MSPQEFPVGVELPEVLEPTLAWPWHPWVLQEGLEAEPLWWET